jgi:hypothetical protein
MVTLSSVEAEYVATSAAAQDTVYLRSLLDGFRFSERGPTEVWEDNAACISMSENSVNRDGSRHVDVKYHFPRERVHTCDIKLLKCTGLSVWLMPSRKVFLALLCLLPHLINP